MKKAIRILLKGGFILSSFFLFFYVYLCFTPFKHLSRFRVYAQGVFELTCPIGSSSLQSMQTFNPATGKSRANFCIDPFGTMTYQGGSLSGGGTLPIGTDTGVANAYVVNPTPSLPALLPGVAFNFTTTHPSTGTSTMNAGGSGAVYLQKRTGADGTSKIVTGDIISGVTYSATWDGSGWILGGLASVPASTANLGQGGSLTLILNQTATGFNPQPGILNFQAQNTAGTGPTRQPIITFNACNASACTSNTGVTATISMDNDGVITFTGGYAPLNNWEFFGQNQFIENVNFGGNDIIISTPLTKTSGDALCIGNTSGCTVNSNTGAQFEVDSVTGKIKSTGQNCTTSASPAVCGLAWTGAVNIAAGATTITVNTSAVSANSNISITENSAMGTRLGVTCNTTTGRTYSATTITAGTSFVITASAAPATNPACLSFFLNN